MAEFLLQSEVESLGCVYTPRTLDIAVENGAFVQFALRSGGQGTVQVAFNQPRGDLESTLTNLGYEIYGSKGTARGYGTLFQLSGHPGEPIDIRLEIVGDCLMQNHQYRVTVPKAKEVPAKVVARQKNPRHGLLRWVILGPERSL